MRKNNIIILSTLLNCSLFIGCNQLDKKNTDSENLFIEVYYLKAGMHFPMSLGCNSLNSPLLSKDIKYKKLNSMDLLEQFDKEFNVLQKEEYQKDVDSRIKVLYHHNKRVDTICMGEIHFIAVNGELKKDSPKLLQLIKNEIYK